MSVASVLERLLNKTDFQFFSKVKLNQKRYYGYNYELHQMPYIASGYQTSNFQLQFQCCRRDNYWVIDKISRTKRENHCYIGVGSYNKTTASNT